MVKNVIGQNGNPVVNLFVIDTKNGKYFQSYNSVVCKIDKKTNKVTLSNHWDYSVTTAKYLYRFLNENTSLGKLNKKEVKTLISKGVITLILTPSLKINL